jgi:hypothetical protein
MEQRVILPPCATLPAKHCLNVWACTLQPTCTGHAVEPLYYSLR